MSPWWPSGIIVFASLVEDNRVWVAAPELATQACETHTGVRGTAAHAVGRGATNGWLITCNDNTVVEIPDGKWED